MDPSIFIIILAGLQSLPSRVTEAATIDGANWFQLIFRVKLPMIRTIILVTLLMRIIDVFRALEVIYTMTFGGPGLSTEVSIAPHLQDRFYRPTTGLCLNNCHTPNGHYPDLHRSC
jgi:multiple sugar transport system permease protein